jgi:hypothetical protein
MMAKSPAQKIEGKLQTIYKNGGVEGELAEGILFIGEAAQQQLVRIKRLEATVSLIAKKLNIRLPSDDHI